MSNRRVFRIVFQNQGKVYEMYARRVGQGELHGFVEVEDLLFGEKSGILVDPGEEQLKGEFSGVSRFHVPFHSVVRIDEVEKEGRGKILSLAGQGEGAAPLPVPGPVKG